MAATVPSPSPERADPGSGASTDFATVPRRPRHDGWTADRQRRFIATLAEMGCIASACQAVGLSPSSAYRLRAHPLGTAFAQAWDRALDVAAARLQALAFDRAINGTVETIWKNGLCVAERRQPDNRLLLYLLAHHAPTLYGRRAVMPDRDPATARDADPMAHGRALLPGLLKNLSTVSQGDCATEQAELFDRDYDEHLPGTRA